MTMELCFDSVVMDLIECENAEEAVDILIHHSREFKEQNIDLQNDWLKFGKSKNPKVTIRVEF